MFKSAQTFRVWKGHQEQDQHLTLAVEQTNSNKQQKHQQQDFLVSSSHYPDKRSSSACPSISGSTSSSSSTSNSTSTSKSSSSSSSNFDSSSSSSFHRSSASASRASSASTSSSSSSSTASCKFDQTTSRKQPSQRRFSEQTSGKVSGAKRIIDYLIATNQLISRLAPSDATSQGRAKTSSLSLLSLKSKSSSLRWPTARSTGNFIGSSTCSGGRGSISSGSSRQKASSLTSRLSASLANSSFSTSSSYSIGNLGNLGNLGNRKLNASRSNNLSLSQRLAIRLAGVSGGGSSCSYNSRTSSPQVKSTATLTASRKQHRHSHCSFYHQSATTTTNSNTSGNLDYEKLFISQGVPQITCTSRVDSSSQPASGGANESLALEDSTVRTQRAISIMVVRSGNKRSTGKLSSSSATSSKQKQLTARLLVLGDKRVGKSATIVRYTTGRFIEQYAGRATSDWLYKHRIELNNNYSNLQQVAQSVEILEQTDIQFCSTNNIFISSNTNQQQQQHQQQQLKQLQPQSDNHKLASRVALDQQIDHELQEKQQLMNKLHWAHAYVVIYAIDDVSTFNKAIKYLNLIANNINSPSQSQKIDTSFSSSRVVSALATATSIGSGGGCVNGLSYSPNGSSSSQSSACSSSSSSSSCSPANLNANRHNAKSNSSLPLIKRPIVLVGNKKDLEKSCRQVSASDARILAMRHQAMFAEVSIAESGKLIESVFVHLIEQIDGSRLHIDLLLNEHQIFSHLLRDRTKTTISRWNPDYYYSSKPTVHQPTTSSPIWGHLVRSRPIGMMQSRQMATIARVENDVRLVRPLNAVALTTIAANRMSSGALKRPSADATLSQQQSEVSLPTRKLSFDQQLNQQQPTHQSRYESLKSSFKRASMAIVSSKALARGSRNSKTSIEAASAAAAAAKRNSIDEDSVISTTTTKDSRNSSVSDLMTSTDSNQSFQQQATSIVAASATKSSTSAFKRPLFRYKSRRKSVAFEQIPAAKVDKAEVVAQHPIESAKTMLARDSTPPTLAATVARYCYLPTTCQQVASATELIHRKELATTPENSGPSPDSTVASGADHVDAAYNPVRVSRDGSSSSLDTSDTYYTSPMGGTSDLEMPVSSKGSSSGGSSSHGSDGYSGNISSGQFKSLQTLRKDSKSTLSQASTSMGSYEDSGDDIVAAASRSSSRASQQQSTLTNQCHQVAKTVVESQVVPSRAISSGKHHLVRSVHSTLTGLTKSHSGSSHAVKKSFCSTLLSKISNNNHAAATTVKIADPSLADLAKVETIKMANIIGYCE